MVDGNRRGPLRIKTALIQAGAGNKRDNHWYPQDVLEAAGQKFVGAKMYMTEHISSEKNYRTEAAVIDSVEGYDQEHGLVANVIAYDPDFCEKVRNLKDSGQMGMLQCSIHATGTVEAGEMAGEQYDIVKTIDEVASVDWVTWGGAGGHAVEASEVSVVESAVVAEAVERTNLPPTVKASLIAREYATVADLTEAVGTVQAELAELVGHVQDNGATRAVVVEVSETEINERILAANKRHLG